MKMDHRQPAERFRKNPPARALAWPGLVGLTIIGATSFAIAQFLPGDPVAPVYPVVASTDDDAPSPRDGTDSRLRTRPLSDNSIAARAGVELSPLGHEDPRWARSHPNTEALATGGAAELKARMAALAHNFASGEDITDRTATAAILRTELHDAETEVSDGAAADQDGIAAASNPAASEEISSPTLQRSAQFGPPAPEQPVTIAAISTEELIETVAPKKEARTTAGVNMRAGPVAGAPIITVVPSGASVGVIGCDVWCEVAYDGKRGWVYRDYVSGYGRGKAQKPAASSKSLKKSPVDRTVTSVTSEGQNGAQNTTEAGFFKSFVRGCVKCDSIARSPVPQSP